MKTLAFLCLLAALAHPATVLHTVPGDEIEGEIVALKPKQLEIRLASGQVRAIVYGMIAAVSVDGKLLDGPFDREGLRNRFPEAADGSEAAAAGPEASAGNREPRETGPERPREEVLRYYVKSSFVMHHTVNGPQPSTSFTKMYVRCDVNRGSEHCGEPHWIGFVGENLAAAVQAVPEARREADRIKLTTGIQAASLIATPVFLFSFVSLANGPKDENGKVQTHIGPGAMTCLILTGVSFANYIGWNIYEGFVARNAISLYNRGPSVSAGFAPGSGRVSLLQTF